MSSGVCAYCSRPCDTVDSIVDDKKTKPPRRFHLTCLIAAADAEAARAKTKQTKERVRPWVVSSKAIHKAIEQLDGPAIDAVLGSGFQRSTGSTGTETAHPIFAAVTGNNVLIPIRVSRA